MLIKKRNFAFTQSILEWNIGGQENELIEKGKDSVGYRGGSCGAHEKSGKLVFFSGQGNNSK